MKLLNAFSLNMISNFPSTIKVEEISLEQAKNIFSLEQVESAVGHTDTAALFTNLLKIQVPVNRTTVSLSSENKVLVGQYIGPRLPEGSVNLPEGATVKWLLVDIQ